MSLESVNFVKCLLITFLYWKIPLLNFKNYLGLPNNKLVLSPTEGVLSPHKDLILISDTQCRVSIAAYILNELGLLIVFFLVVLLHAFV